MIFVNSQIAGKICVMRSSHRKNGLSAEFVVLILGHIQTQWQPSESMVKMYLPSGLKAARTTLPSTYLKRTLCDFGLPAGPAGETPLVVAF
jgi:hypothetical protein